MGTDKIKIQIQTSELAGQMNVNVGIGGYLGYMRKKGMHISLHCFTATLIWVYGQTLLKIYKVNPFILSSLTNVQEFCATFADLDFCIQRIMMSIINAGAMHFNFQ